MRGWITGRSRWVVAGAVVVAAASALVLLRSEITPGGPQAGGPLEVPNDHGYAITLPVGTTFTDGFEVLRLSGDEPAVVEDVTITGDDGLVLVGAMLAPPPRLNAAVQLMRSWPPRHRQLDEETFVEAVGARIEPLPRAPMGYELLLGIRVADEGYLVRESVTVTYRVGEETYEVDLPAQIAVCTDTGLEIGKSCPFPQDAPPGHGDS